MRKLYTLLVNPQADAYELQRNLSKTGLSSLVLLLSLAIGSFSLVGQCDNCLPLVNFGIGQDCIDTVRVNDLTSNTSSCIGDLSVRLIQQGVILDSTVSFDQVGSVLQYEIINDSSGHVTCAGNIRIKDGFNPRITTCPNDTVLSCFQEPTNLGVPTAIDCESNLQFDFIDMWTNNGCMDTTMVLERRHEVSDLEGNTDQCTQFVYFLRPHIDSIDFPGHLLGDSALECGINDNTSPFFTGFPSYGGMEIEYSLCDYVVQFEDQVDEGCGETRAIKRTWHLVDVCSDSHRLHVQLIAIADTTGPDFDLPDTLFFQADDEVCAADIVLPMLEPTDLCGSEFNYLLQGPFANINSNGGTFSGVPVGVHKVRYTVSDICLNKSIDSLVVVVQDLSPPLPICKTDLVIPLPSSGEAWVDAESFDHASMDNCSGVYFKARRMAANKDCLFDNPDNLFADKVAFCCDDAQAESILIILRVYDIYPGEGLIPSDSLEGHYAECMLEVTVQDKVAPVLVCPSDLTVSCELVFDIDNPGVFGQIVSDQGDREPICINDPAQGGEVCSGLDGIVTDVCGVSVESALVDQTNTCGIGTILRTVEVEDMGGNIASCVQTIEVENFNPFDINQSNSADPADDVIWPEDYYVSDICNLDALQPGNLPTINRFPILTEDGCDQVVANYEDEVFDFSLDGDACVKILREWLVIDWCQSTGDSLASWRYQQTIVVENSVAPEIQGNFAPLILCSDEDCGPVQVSVDLVAIDDCTPANNLNFQYALDANSDDFLDLQGEGSSFAGMLPIGVHTLIWSVEDLCGNTTTRSRTIDVRSCKLPTPVCHEELVTVLMPIDNNGDGNADVGMVEVNAAQLDKGSFQACGYDVTASFSSDVSDVSRMFDCSDLGTNPVEIWITDEKGNQEFCEVSIVIQDQNNIPGCDNFQNDEITIAGLVYAPDMGGLANVEMQLGQGLASLMTDTLGYFEFEPMPSGGTYVVAPSYSSDYKEGLSTLDILKIQRHILGVELFDDPAEYIAADVNSSGSISALDMLEIRKLLLGAVNSFPSNSSWRFFNPSYPFVDPEKALEYEFEEDYTISALTTDIMDISFRGVKIGDVNGSAMDSDGLVEIESRSEDIGLVARDLFLPRGIQYDLPISLPEAVGMRGFQVSIKVDTQHFQVLGLPSQRADFSTENYRVDPESGELHISWISEDMKPYDGGVLGYIQVESKISGRVSEGMSLSTKSLNPEAYMDNNEVIGIKMEFLDADSKAINNHEFVPNPFSDYTTLRVEMDRPGQLILEVFNATGQQVLRKESFCDKGNNEILVENRYFTTDGIYYCKLSAFEEVTTSKLIYLHN